MPVTMICPNLACGRTVSAPDAARGKVVRCTHCQQIFMVPLPAAPASDAGKPGAAGKSPKR